MTSRRSFLRSIIAAVALAPVLARMKFEQPAVDDGIVVRHSVQVVNDIFLKESARLGPIIHSTVMRPNPWNKLIA